MTNLRVSGALVARAAPGAAVTLDGLAVSNEGWEWRPTEEVGLGGKVGVGGSRGVALRKVLSTLSCQRLALQPPNQCVAAACKHGCWIMSAGCEVLRLQLCSLPAGGGCFLLHTLMLLPLPTAAPAPAAAQCADVTEVEAMRGFRVVRHATHTLAFDTPGTYQVPPPAAAPADQQEQTRDAQSGAAAAAAAEHIEEATAAVVSR